MKKQDERYVKLAIDLKNHANDPFHRYLILSEEYLLTLLELTRTPKALDEFIKIGVDMTDIQSLMTSVTTIGLKMQKALQKHVN